MKHTFPLRGIAACIGMFILILDSETALLGARSGIELIIYTVIPSLFPFFFLSALLIGTPGMNTLSVLQPMAKLFRIPDAFSFLLIPAFLGGYPTGAQAITSAWKQGTLTEQAAQRLLGFCSNIGPSFLFGILTSCFPEWWMCWALWGLHISGALAAAWLIPHNFQVSEHRADCPNPKPLYEILIDSLRVMGSVCGWLLLFRVILAFFQKWIFWYFPIWLQVFFSGMLELTNGCCMLTQIADIRLRFVVCSILLSLGGLCVYLQTKSVTMELSLRWYVIGKGIQTLFSACVSAAILYRTWVPLVPLSTLGIPLLKHKKRIAFRRQLLYNGFK